MSSARLFVCFCLVVGAAGCPPVSRRGTAYNVRVLSGGRLVIDKSPKKIYLLYFWRTQIKKGARQLSYLERLHKTYGPRGLKVVGINQDDVRRRSLARSLIARARLSFPHVSWGATRIRRELNRQSNICHAVILHKGKVLQQGSLCWPDGRQRLDGVLEELFAPRGSVGPPPSGDTGGMATPE